MVTQNEDKRLDARRPVVLTVKKGIKLLRRHGIVATSAVVMSVVEDSYLRVFDRRYGVRTSGYVQLASTSLGDAAVNRGHRYRAVNAWAFKKFMAKWAPHQTLRFVDMGCGFGRACLLAAEYGFSRVRGVDMVPEFCDQARDNAKSLAGRGGNRMVIEILQADAIDYSRDCDDDLVFLYNPFPVPVLESVVTNLLKTNDGHRPPAFLVYSERILESSPTLAFLQQTKALRQVMFHSSWGQAFYVFAAR